MDAQTSTHAMGLVKAVLNAEVSQVPSIVESMRPYRQWTDPILNEQLMNASTDSATKLRASLALLPMDGAHVRYLFERMLNAAPNELSVIVNSLGPHQTELLEELWLVASDDAKDRTAARLRAATALAQYDPATEKWLAVCGPIVDELVAVSPLHLLQWIESFRPVRARLIPALSTVFRDLKRRETERDIATAILAEYAADQATTLIDLTIDADDKQFAVLFPKVAESIQATVSLLNAVLDQEPFLPDVASADERRETRAKRQANAAVTLARLGQASYVWPLLSFHPEVNSDPRLRSYLIHRLPALGFDDGLIMERLNQESDMTVRRALMLALGQYSPRELGQQFIETAMSKIREIYQVDADPGVHAATEWVLKRWEQQDWLKQVTQEWSRDALQRERKQNLIYEQIAEQGADAALQWYVDRGGQTMVVIPGPVEFVMGAHNKEVGRHDYEPQHRMRIGRSFAVSSTLVTLEQFRKFQENYRNDAAFVRSPDLPVAGVTWFTAVKYCNWYSQQEQIPEDQWCFVIDGDSIATKPNYLSLSGYRLPTEAELEYAARSGSTTARFFGETVELLPFYGWYANNSDENIWPVGSLKPNDYGLFDIHGNVWQWHQEKPTKYPYDGSLRHDVDDDPVVTLTDARGIRGGGLYSNSASLRSACRASLSPGFRGNSYGFRLARTVATAATQ